MTVISSCYLCSLIGITKGKVAAKSKSADIGSKQPRKKPVSKWPFLPQKQNDPPLLPNFRLRGAICLQKERW